MFFSLCTPVSGREVESYSYKMNEAMDDMFHASNPDYVGYYCSSYGF